MSVFHLKYRPQNFSELDLTEVSATLRKILQNKEMPQSFLFTGPKGAGKTSAARILAKAVNCTELKDGEPCGKCDNCLEIAKGSSLDVIEIDGASNRGIEDIRSLKDKAYLLPSKLAKKVFIIDEVHMLTKEAFNAMLKLIEEPPAHTIFVLCTTDETKIPETVLSRLVKVGFHKGSVIELVKSLQRIVRGEKVEVEEKDLEMIAQKSDGSFRNLQKTFNEMVLQYGKKITRKEIEEFFETRFGKYEPEELEKDLVAGEAKEILKKISKLAEKGIDFRGYRENLLQYFQGRLLAAFGVGNEKKSELTVSEIERWLGLLINAGKQEKDLMIAELPLQLAVVDFLGEKKPIPKEGKEITKEETEKETREEVKEEKIIAVGVEIEKVEQEWEKILVAVKPYNHSVEAFLRAAKPKALRGRTLELEVFYPFHKDKLEEAKNREIVETGLKKVLGVELLFECVLGKNKRKPLVINNETPVEKVSELLKVEDKKNGESGDMYEVAKQIFG